MKRENRPVTSREYKLSLNPDRFCNRQEGLRDFWHYLSFLLRRRKFCILAEQHDEFVRRTWYLDTPGLELNRLHMILRVREEQGEKRPFKMTLKYRHPDRYIAAAQEMACAPDLKDEEWKFEEDITPPFISQFSHSLSFRAKELPPLTTIAEAADLFPGLKDMDLLKRARLESPDGFCAHEIVRWLGQVVLKEGADGKRPEDAAFTVKASLTFWYLIDGGAGEVPLVSEFSFDYDLPDKERHPNDRLENYPLELVRNARQLYIDLQEHPGWMLAKPTTKTAFALEAM